jgi:cytochrome c oxidase subunit 4
MDQTQAHSALTAAEAQAAGIEHEHPGWSVYWKVAVILTVITIGEVWVYYIPAFVASRLFLPTLLAMSAVKFAIVVLFYMHLRYDNKVFRVLFTGPLMVAVLTLFALLFLFGHLRLGHGG